MQSPFFTALRTEIKKLGGLHNAHLHLDRANTFDLQLDADAQSGVAQTAHVSLQQKHARISAIHDSPTYDTDNLIARVSSVVEHMIAVGTRVADTVVDITPDRVGTTALDAIMTYAETVKDQITLRAASYTPLGFDDTQPERWDLFAKAAETADFIGSLPEADDTDDYPTKIGYEEHCRRVVSLAQQTGKMLQVHTDQANVPQENGTEKLLSAMEHCGRHDATDGSPLVWAVHVISPTTYDDARWDRLVARMRDMNLGVICCPSGAIGMRQIRGQVGPTDNSIARVLDLAAAGVPVRLGSDNIADMLSPSTTGDLVDEVFLLSAAVRFYDIPILAKFATGTALTDDDRAQLRDHLEHNNAEIAKTLRRWQSA